MNAVFGFFSMFVEQNIGGKIDGGYLLSSAAGAACCSRLQQIITIDNVSFLLCSVRHINGSNYVFKQLEIFLVCTSP